MTEEEFDLSPPPKPKTAEDTPLARLEARLTKTVERDPFLLEVPDRPDISLFISPNIDKEQMKRWRKTAGEGVRNKEFDLFHFSTLVIAGTTQGIYMDGEEVRDGNDYPLSFASPEIKKMLDVETPLPGVKKMFGIDPHVEAAAMTILEKAGYGDTVEALDNPLKSS